MELEVRVVGGMESCFVSLPLSLIQTLQSTSGDFLPPVIALELRSYAGASWSVAWSGSASKTSAIEIGQQVAECISLPNGTKVQVKAIGNLPKASLVNIEPISEDDWEILELNSEAAEEVILQQVGIVFEGMRFPLWLNGHMVVEFIVVSISPTKPVVQLVPGTKVAVRPKCRKSRFGSCSDVQIRSSTEQKGTTAIVRIQASKVKHMHKLVFGGVELGVVLTSVVYLHPETARKLSFDNLQLVVIEPRLPRFKAIKNLKDTTQRRGGDFANTEGNTEGSSTSTRRARHTILRILYSDAVVKGHVMLPKAVCLYLRASAHSWVCMKKYFSNSIKDVSLLTLSPCQFKLPEKNDSIDKGKLNVFDSRQNLRRNTTSISSYSLMNMNVADWEQHGKFLESIFDKACVNGDKKGVSRLDTKWEQRFLIQSWFIGQLKELALHTSQMELTSITLPKEAILHFEITNLDLGSKSTKPMFSDLEKQTEQCTFELLYLLVATFDESCHDQLKQSYELALNYAGNKDVCSITDLGVVSQKLEFGDPLHLDSVVEGGFGRKLNLNLSSLSWMEKAATEVINRLLVLLSPSSLKLLNTFNVSLPGHVLIYGPPGSGKSTLIMAIAKHLEEHEEILAHIIFISCAKLALEKSQTIRQVIADYVSEALVHSPSIIIFDDLDNIISFSSDSEGSHTSTSVIALANFLIDIMDEYRENSQNSCGYGCIAFVASAQSLGKLPHLLTSSGRFDFHVELPAPAVSERGAILKHEIVKRGLYCSEDIISEVASKCDGFDAYDLEILVDRAVHAAICHSLAFHDKEPEKPVLVKDDFSQAIHGFVPVSMRGLTNAGVEGGRHSGWEDIGGLSHVRNAIQEMVELPSKFPNVFAHSPLRMRSNVLLYGPPGCGKTHIIGAAAVACSLRFISIKGPELLNKYIGASEQAVRDLFSKAAAAAPCLLFFDEFDSIAPKRGHDNTGVTDRVVNQLLTELDGVEALTGVFVFAATSRPDLLDAALLRPGRLDRLLFCDFPSCHERLDILKVLSRKLPLSADVNLEVIASMAEGFSGADLQALLSDAQLASVHELLDREASDKREKIPVINDVLLKSVASKARPSVSEAEKRRLYGIYSQFLDSKKSVAAQSRDIKGKRATLA